MSIWHCPTHGLVGPTPCCITASLARFPETEIQTIIDRQFEGSMHWKSELLKAKDRIRELEADLDTARARACGWNDRCRELEAALKMLMRAYVNTLEGGRDRILALGGTCDDVPTMEDGDPALRHAKRVLGSPPSDATVDREGKSK